MFALLLLKALSILGTGPPCGDKEPLQRGGGEKNGEKKLNEYDLCADAIAPTFISLKLNLDPFLFTTSSITDND